jgi:NADPH:quinone reductase-like Zn-dependent oxidoreductase
MATGAARGPSGSIAGHLARIAPVKRAKILRSGTVTTVNRFGSTEIVALMVVESVSCGRSEAVKLAHTGGDRQPGSGCLARADPAGRAAAGETVLVLGATGVSGRIAVALAARMGAGRVIAAGRNRAVLDQLPATVTVALGGPDDAAALAEAAGQDGIHVIVDYLWGHPTEAAIAAITRRGLAHAAPRVRLVEVGQMAGPVIALPADVQRSGGLEVLGSGPGAIPLTDIVGAIPRVMAIAATGDLPINIDEVPLAEVEAAWLHGGGRRIVLRP